MLDSVFVSQGYVAEAMMVVCPKCKSEIDVEEEELEEGELVSCLECDSDFEVVSLDPLELKKVIDEEEADEEDE
jgi:alpha-aminoadipate carrier protein LysW